MQMVPELRELGVWCMMLGSGSDLDDLECDMESPESEAADALQVETVGPDTARETQEEDSDLTSMVGTRSASWMGAGGSGRRGGGGGSTPPWRKRSRSPSEEPRKTKSKARPKPKPTNAPELASRGRTTPPGARERRPRDGPRPATHSVPPEPSIDTTMVWWQHVLGFEEVTVTTSEREGLTRAQYARVDRMMATLTQQGRNNMMTGLMAYMAYLMDGGHCGLGEGAHVHGTVKRRTAIQQQGPGNKTRDG